MGKDDLYKKNKKKLTEDRRKVRIARESKILVFSEGAETEPNYFSKLCEYYNKCGENKIHLIPLGMGKNTTSLVRSVDDFLYSVDEKYSDIPYDKTFVVFDRDSFGKANFNTAVSLAKENGYEPIISNQSFELWLLLHFYYIDADLERGVLNQKLSVCLKQKYNKSDKNIFNKILLAGGKVENAIKYAKKLEDNYKGKKFSPVNKAPYTAVYKIAEYLEKRTQNLF